MKNKKGKPRIKKGTFLRLIKLAYGKNKLQTIIGIICLVVGSLAMVAGSTFIRIIIDDYIDPISKGASLDVGALISNMIVMIVFYICGIIATYVAGRMMLNISTSTLRDARGQLFTHMQTLPLDYFDGKTHGEVMSIFTNDTDTLRQLVSQSIPSVIMSFSTIISAFTIMCITSLELTSLVVVMIVLMTFVTGKIAKSSSRHFVAQQKSIGLLNGFIEEMTAGQKTIKVFNYEGTAERRFKDLNGVLEKENREANGISSMMMPIMANLGYLNYVLCAVIGGLMIANNFGLIGVLTAGGLVSFLMLSRQFTGPITNIAQQYSFLAMGLAGADRIFSLLDATSEVDNGKVTLVQNNDNTWSWKKDDALIPLKGDVRFNDVDFSYVLNKQVLFDISLFAKPGQKIAFVGSTGAGKTTITNLINRFYDISSGTITYDGIDIKEITKNSLRDSLGMVLQDVNLFTGTVRDNIKYGNLTASEEEVLNAAKRANADSFIKQLPNGYDTILTHNGANLSQGQRQLLAIARTAIANPPVLILDEATSSIDTRTEKLVQDGMDMLMENRTVFVIAHRLSTIRNAKAIMVLEHGKIIERGNHEDLMKLKGRYYELYTGKAILE